MQWYDARWFTKALRQYADFSGRARRAEFWMFSLVSAIISVALIPIDTFVLGFDTDVYPPLIGGYGPLGWLYELAVLVPTYAVGARRLHDTGHRGWWQLVSAPLLVSAAIGMQEPIVVIAVLLGVAILGGLAVLVMLALDGTPEPNRWGPNPKTDMTS